MCMGDCGKSSAKKSNSYTPKKTYNHRQASPSSRGGRSSGTNFGTPKVRMSFTRRGSR